MRNINLNPLALICEKEEELEIQTRGRKPRQLTQVAKFYQKYGSDWVQQFYQEEIYLAMLREELNLEYK